MSKFRLLNKIFVQIRQSNFPNCALGDRVYFSVRHSSSLKYARSWKKISAIFNGRNYGVKADENSISSICCDNT